MKPGIKILIILMGLIVGGCEYGISPEIPAPLSPDGADYVISDGKMMFSWEAVQGAQKYAIEIGADRRFEERVYFYVVYGVTEHGVSLGYFEPEEDYFWRVAAYLDADLADWSNPVKFTYIPPFIDLDTTYFPFGLEYEWCYERKHYEHTFSQNQGDWDTTYYDTFTITVVDSMYDPYGWDFTLEGGGFQDIVSEGFEVLLMNNQYRVPVFWDTLLIDPPADNLISINGEIKVAYEDDTLSISVKYDDEYNTKYTHATCRLKGTGAICQSYEETRGESYTLRLSDRLLYLYDGHDTLYKAPDQALYIQTLAPPNSGLDGGMQ